MRLKNKIKRAIRGEVKLTTAALEAWRRGVVTLQRRRERTGSKHATLILTDSFARMTADQLVGHFRGEREAKFFETEQSPPSANRIVDDHCWPLLGFGERCFGKDIRWTCDPLSNYVWPLEYHADINLRRMDGSDVRVLWELNRLGHFLTLASAYASTSDERYAAEFFTQLQSWVEQNPYGRGPNWNCAMEVALRAMNLLAAFEVFRQSPQMDAGFLRLLLKLLQQHGTHIQRNLEFSYIATSNHYLSDVVGLAWLGLMVPELAQAKEWRDFGLKQMLREMEKQVLPDGADFEASTGYHRFVTELFLYSFLLCRANNVEIQERYWSTLHGMLRYIHAYLRPDGYAPLIGDTDSGQVLPFVPRRADDHGYLLDIGAAVFNDASLKTPSRASQAFPNAGMYIMRHEDLYLCFNASGVGISGRGSHGHNDALSIEVSAGARAFIVDPGTYVYSADLAKRHDFRSTAFHSTVQIDGLEQNTINVDTPFVIGNEAKPRVLEWQTGDDFDKVVGEHYGYPVTHRRTVTFKKRERCWLIDDEFFGEGEHVYEARFHFAPGLDIAVDGSSVTARDGDVRVTVSSLNGEVEAQLENQSVSHDYGQMRDAISACWKISGELRKLTWQIESV
jgi:hypothetical protein